MDGDIFWMITVAIIASIITPAIMLVLVIYGLVKDDDTMH